MRPWDSAPAPEAEPDQAAAPSVPLAAGTYLHLCIDAANRDPEAFHDPDRLDLGRSPNRHLAFATGVHICAGASLARMEGQVAIGKLVRACPNYAPDGPPVRGGRARFRGFAKLPVTWSNQ
jgi:cytochrome P450